MRALSILHMEVREEVGDGDACSLCWEGQGGSTEPSPLVPPEVSRSLESVSGPRSSPRSCCSVRFSETVKTEGMENA